MCEYLSGRFIGWRIAGNYLVSPDGDRMTPERLKGLVWRDSMELRLAGYASRRKAEAAKKRFAQQTVKVVVVNLSSWRDRHFGTMAG
ncbi:phage protein [Xanthomonas campestris pv. merremiae]|nr:phage protein [Xanthomonas campestris pv. merremiae]